MCLWRARKAFLLANWNFKWFSVVTIGKESLFLCPCSHSLLCQDIPCECVCVGAWTVISRKGGVFRFNRCCGSEQEQENV